MKLQNANPDSAVRKMTADDILSARRGLAMKDKTVEQLGQLIDHHSTIDLFASKVIVEAAHREIDDRWVRYEIN